MYVWRKNGNSKLFHNSDFFPEFVSNKLFNSVKKSQNCETNLQLKEILLDKNG